MVLCTTWLATLGTLSKDIRTLSMAFWRDGRLVQWRGEAGPRRPHLHACTPESLMDALLAEFEDVFTAPVGLLPEHFRDHHILLKPSSIPVVVRPYRYPALQKDELEHQCRVMEEQGLIHRSSSPFSSSVLLVKKPDNSWRFCVDYRELNAQTVKDKFPIPVADELFDELHGACFFSKLDLSSGYHQVRMHPDDVHKTVFHTHEVLYEFLVMAFGLTNAPATFQAFMNEVLRPFLRRFFFVFFDDILVYSNSWAEHLQHLRLILDMLRAHRLFVKCSKCAFGTTFVAYLGHDVSAEGVAMDINKVRAVQDWLQSRSTRILRGFLELAGYYRKFIKDFGAVAAPLTRLLQKNAFAWSGPLQQAYLCAAVISDLARGTGSHPRRRP